MQFLDENKSLILKIVENQNAGKMSECAENQARLQRNLMYLAAIADSQPQPPSMLSQYAAGGMMQPGAHYLQNQQQQLTQQSLMAGRSSMMYSQQPYAALQQQQLHNQFGLSSGGSNSLHMLQSEGHSAGSTATFGGMGFPDFGSRSATTERGMPSGMKQEIGGSSSGAQGGESGEHLYLKTGDDGN
ncbi:transcription cofactor [Lithospermum erythrorhizon]|uniref:Transcription cofactor n=1 Tax=Lithospermum erythrorhizon TaxID=34254 RepID=A0AAV3NR03_LITER